MASSFLTTEEVEIKSREANPPKPLQPLLDKLNQNQLSAVYANDQYIRVIAGPGSGKTATLMARIARLIHDKVDAKSILALSFTNESANELLTRVEDQAGYDGSKVQVGTFHAKFYEFLKKYRKHPFLQDRLGYKEGFYIIETNDAKKLMIEAIAALPSDLKLIFSAVDLDQKKIFKALTKHRSSCKNANILAKEILADNKQYKLDSWKALTRLAINASDPEEISSVVGSKLAEQPFLRDMLITTIWRIYSELCKKNHAIDFDDILLHSYFLLKYNPDVSKEFSSQFTHILCDEMQDSNEIQLALLNELIKSNLSCAIYLVGDPRQSIYGFRQALVENMTQVEDKLQVPFKTYELVHNYRSTKALVDVANCFASEMYEQTTTGQLIAGNDSLLNTKSHIIVNHFQDEKSEADFVLSEVQNKLANGVPPADIYVMYRSRSAAKPLEKLFIVNNIPHEMVGEANLYERQEVRDTMAFLRSICRKKDTLAWARTIDAVKIGVTGTLLRAKSKEIEELIPRDFILSRKNNRNKITIDAFIELHDACSEFLLSPSCVAEFAKNYPKNTLEEVQYAVNNQPAVTKAFNEWVGNDIKEMVEIIKEKWLESVLPTYEKIDIKRANKSQEVTIEELTENRKNSISSIFNELSKRLQNGSTLKEIVEDLMLRDTPTRKDRQGTIKLLTIHASKGLESKNVFVLGADTAIWDPRQQKEGLKAEAEDQRLYYVMFTRAEENIYISTVAYRNLNGKGTPSKPCKQLVDHLFYAEQTGVISRISVKKTI